MKRFFIFMLFCCLLTMTTDADEDDDVPTDKIQKSLIKPIQVFIVGQSIEVSFNVTVGITVISIYNEMGSAVYQQSVTAYAGQQTFIGIVSFEEGEYTIEIVNSQGQYLFTNFIIQ
jgi:hypothetical protein